MSEIVDRLNNAIMRGPIETPAWVCNTMRDAITHIALLEKACEASATYIRHDSLRPSAAHKNAFFRLCDAGYLGEGGDE